jgi:hypothetical protein
MAWMLVDVGNDPHCPIETFQLIFGRAVVLSFVNEFGARRESQRI